MFHRFFGVVALSSVAVLSVGCSSSDGDGDDSGGPVASGPLAGTIDGKPFTAKSAIATPDKDGGKTSITVYDIDVTCESSNPQVDRRILTSVPWKAGTERNLKLDFSDLNGSQTVTFVLGSSNNIISNSGRIEVLEAPSEKGAKGKIRLRASAQSHSVEGEVAVTVCPRGF
jgi:hypothetical protein